MSRRGYSPGLGCGDSGLTVAGLLRLILVPLLTKKTESGWNRWTLPSC